MQEKFAIWYGWLQSHPELETLLASVALLLAAWLGNWIVKRILVRGLMRIVRHWRTDSEVNKLQSSIIRRLANIVPALIMAVGVRFIPGLPETLISVIENVSSSIIMLTVALAVGSMLELCNTVYNHRPNAHLKPIKGYLQVVSIAIYAITTVLIIATLIDRSPLILLSGLGAMAAVLMLIFQDTLLSLVASVQISSNDVVRVGDWIQMPGLNADGDVIDIALHTVKVQNFDKTITTIPTKRMISESFKNFRGMQQSGGRRIKRSIFLDQQSVSFLSEEEYQRLLRFNLLTDYLTNKRREIDEWNTKLAERGKEAFNTRRVTNIGTLRAYIERYLRNHPGVHQTMTLLVRQLSPTAEGLPLEVYCFTNTVVWANYESIQSDIFDHLLAIIPEFGLKVFQSPSGADLLTLGQGLLRASQEHAEAEHGEPARLR